MSLFTRIFALFILFDGLFSPVLTAQCPINVDAGPDKFVCNPGGTTGLEGSVSGPFIGFRWSPATGLNNPALLNPTATVNNTVTYTLTAAAVDPSAPNLVTNPGFEAGNTGFSSSYSYNPTPIFPGTYVITTSPSVVLDNFPPCDDHTYGNGTGYMMLCNGTGGSNSQVWCQNIPVMANTWYVMSAWVLCSPISPPVFQFRVNGADAGDPFDAQPLGCVWQEFTASWFSGASTSANLCIFDISGSGNGLFGDDFALDDIFMAKACTESDQVTVSVAQVKAMLPSSVILPCSAAETGIVLNGSGSSSGPGYSYSWSGPGIISGEDTPTPTVNEPGVYTLTVSFDTGNGICTKTASINVQPDPLQVTAKAAVNAQLSCANTTVLLNGTGSSVGGVISYDWQPSGGVVSGNGTLTPLVNQPGEYTLLVTNTASGCTATATVVVNQNLAPALAAASAPGPLSCTADTVFLSGAGSSTGNNFSYLWSGPGIVSGNNTLNNCAINAPGQYLLVVTNKTSGCTASASVAVIPTDSLPPAVATAGAPGVLNCVTPALTLRATSADSLYTYLWTTPNGHFTSPADTQTVTIDSAGLYILTVLNPQNGCTATDTLNIAGNFTPPADSVLPVPSLTCTADSVQIDASLSSGGPGFKPVWTTSGGLILGGDSTLTPWVGAGGTYTLTIADTLNGCTTTATVAVTVDTIPPVAVAAAPGVLNCATPALTLNSAGSSDSIFTFQWATTNGHFAGPVNGQTATVDTVGTYILIVTNLLNGCQAADTVVVSGAFDPPLAIIGQPAPSLTCSADSVQIDASSSSAGPDFQFGWSSSGGTILSGIGTASPWVGAPGTYQLLVTDLTNGCTATAGISIALDTVAPIVQIAVPAVLDCQTTALPLDAGGSSSGPGFAYQWSFAGPGNGIVSGDTTLMPVVNAAGIYTLTVTNKLNGCTANAGIQVQQSADVPLANAGQTATLPCNITQLILDGSLSASGPNIVYAWSTPDGHIVQGENTLYPVVNAAGIYVLTVTDTLNSCSAVSQVLVQSDTNAPNADAGPAQSITCLTATPALDGSGSSAGAGISYLWTTADGLIVSGDSSATPLVGAAGTYLLLVTDQTNGCTATASVVVTTNTVPPVAAAASPQTLTCALTQIALDGAGSSAGANFSYQWSGPGMVSGETTL
ncbi:MAG: PKD domain-containing protein, partial [Thermoanaerobaculia bacterium]|nr:PKD domain-containing protein [Thermoanaerobaculia bacterium]